MVGVGWAGPAAWVPRGQSADWCRTRSRAICCRRAICPPAALNIINVSYNRTIASCDSVDVVLRCPKTLGPVGLVGASEVRFLLAPRASGFKCLMWRAANACKKRLGRRLCLFDMCPKYCSYTAEWWQQSVVKCVKQSRLKRDGAKPERLLRSHCFKSADLLTGNLWKLISDYHTICIVLLSIYDDCNWKKRTVA